MYQYIRQILEETERRHCSIAKVVLENEISLTDKTEEEIYARLREQWEVMKHSAFTALEEPQHMVPPLISGQSSRQNHYSHQKKTLLGSEINEMMAQAFSGSEVNAAMGKICATPTAGACGILPAVLLYAAKKSESSEEEILNALLVAAGIGTVITKNATVSGAEGGCQAECGTAGAMAAAAAVYLYGGSPKQSATAASITLINCMGLICDPVAGLVQMPCSYRNVSQSISALASADMALAGQECVIPPDEVIEAMYKVGRRLPLDFRETALGGIAGTKTGCEIAGECSGCI